MKYTPDFKLRVIEKAREWDNVSKSADAHDVARRTVYIWMEQESQIRQEAEQVADEEIVISDRRKEILDRLDNVLPKSIDSADRYLRMLKERGTIQQRKEALNAMVEATLWQVIDTLEKSDWGEVHPKDLSKIMTDLESVREKLAGEPTVIIEERNKMKELVIVAAKDLFGADKAKELVNKIATMQEAEYQEVG